MAAPLNAAMARYQVHPAQWEVVWDANTLQTVVNGSTSPLTRMVVVQTGTTANSRAQREAAGVGSNDIFMASPSQNQTFLDFSKQVTVGFAFAPISVSGATSEIYFRLGQAAGTSGNLAARGIGIRIANLTLTGVVHNGTTLNTSATLKTLVAGSVTTWVVMQSDGAGNVAFYIDGVLAATLTGGPTSGIGGSTFAVECLNGATAANTRAQMNQPRIRVD
jgi:uncharacterized membrane protein